ncbi:hypothetical protein NBRC10513v2_006464 [Rhodotorula toruloides]|uniref:BY PROTMAP: gi/472582319/gb/EMS20011.1/ beta-Ig-H3/Fasciclin [Rhodosporidium toruloides NP11] gi/647400224/emb/CDR45510.1/ RHTO0S11e01178g1_1 [Rhodosporidium toruloides] n=1 Tax=Rhodotorula toruloides TaxID=5286 RepID=A0A0K3CB11_RHOTO|nr:FAS1 domain-containing protein [Rhodotorula toruloides]
MKFSTAAITAALFALASAQNSTGSGGNSTQYSAGLLQALQAANLTTLASLAQSNAATLLPLLQNGNHTVFAPSNEAFAALPENVTSNQALVANTLLYHVYSGNLMSNGSGHQILRSALNDSMYVQLPGNQSQVGVFMTNGNSSSNGNNSSMSMMPQQVTWIGATQNVTSTMATQYQNLNVYVVPQVLSIPMNLTATAQAAGLTNLVGALQQYAPQAVPALASARGVTIFAPVNAAFQAAMSAIGQLNQTQIADVLLNHVLNGTVAYSTQLGSAGNLTTAGGAPISFMTNSTGAFVMTGNATAQIIRADIPISNGVVHLIGSVLANAESNPQAAASAASSASKAGASQTGMQTGAVTATGSSPSGSSKPSSGAGSLDITKSLTLGGALAAVGALVFA